MSKTGVYHDDKGNPLPCYGCGHSDGSAAYPSKPSGERPCMFCIRNLEQAKWLAEFRERHPGVIFTARYDNGSTQKEVGDQYIATDRIFRDLPVGTHIIT